MRLVAFIILAIALSACGTSAPILSSPVTTVPDTPTPGIIIVQADAEQRLAIINAEATQAKSDLNRVNAIVAQQAANALQTAEAFTRSVTATANHLFVISETAKLTQQAQWVDMTAAAAWANATQQARATDIYMDAERARVNAKIQSDERWERYKENTGLVLFSIICLAVLVFCAVIAYRFDAFIVSIIRVIIDWRDMRTREKLVELAARRVIDVGGSKKWIDDDGRPTDMLPPPSAPVADTKLEWLRACKQIAMYANEFGWSHDDLGEVSGGAYILSRTDWDNATDYLRDCGVLFKKPKTKTRYEANWDYARMKSDFVNVMLPISKPPPVVKHPQMYTGELSKVS